MELSVPGPVGRIEAVLERPPASASSPFEPERPLAAAVVCHPHPEYGGTMKNAIVVRIARALRAAGLATLRFNFRGVGGSEGSHDGEGGEERDVAACLDLLGREVPGIELWAAGYSFGARAVARLALEDERIRRLVLVAFPVEVFDCPGIELLRVPGLALFGSEDEFGTLSSLRRRCPVPPAAFELDEISGADHFFRGRTPLVEERVRAYALRAIEETP